MKFLSKISLSHWAIFVSTIALLWISANLNFGKENWKEIVRTDGKGYYAYLPAVFIYDDLNFGFYEHIENEKYFNPKTGYDYRSGAEGEVISKYYCGTAVAQMPFFLVAHFTTSISGGDADGYSKAYMLSVAFATIFYLFLGLFFINKTLVLYSVADSWRAFSILAIVFGTNLFFYSVGEPSISHVYSFGFISLFVFLSKKYLLEGNTKQLPVIGLVLGMIVLIRPINGLVLLIWPFLAGDFENLKRRVVEVFQNYSKFILALVFFFGVVFIQLLYYKLATGSFWVYSYGEEGFNWTKPHFLDILFSYKKGLFLYTPLYLISFIGLFFIWKKSKFESLSWLVFFVLITYVFSSWHMWWYGGSFSGRIYVEFLPVFVIPLAIAFQSMRSKIQKIGFSILIVVIILLCQVQTFQYRYYKIHWDSMTKELYWKEFMRIDRIKD